MCIVANIRGSFLELEFSDFFTVLNVRLVFGKYKTRYHNILHEWFNLQLCFGKFRINLRIKSLPTLSNCCVWHNVRWLHTTFHKSPFSCVWFRSQILECHEKCCFFRRFLFEFWGNTCHHSKLQKNCRCCWWHMLCLTRFLLSWLICFCFSDRSNSCPFTILRKWKKTKLIFPAEAPLIREPERIFLINKCLEIACFASNVKERLH